MMAFLALCTSVVLSIVAWNWMKKEKIPGLIKERNYLHSEYHRAYAVLRNPDIHECWKQTYRDYQVILKERILNLNEQLPEGEQLIM